MTRFRLAPLLGAFRRPAYLKDAAPLRLQELDTGDLVLFSGRSLAARLVQGVTGSYWSHVGIVVRLPGHAEPLLWEATRASGVADIHRQECFDGVQLVSLARKLASYRGEVAVRRLLDAGSGSLRYQCMRPLIQALHARPYCNVVVKRLRIWWRGIEAAEWRHGGFCSEFVADVYKHLHLLPPHRPSIDFLPRDFGPEALLRLRRGRLSPVCLLAG